MENIGLNIQMIREFKEAPSRLRWYINRPISLALITTGILFLFRDGYWYPVRVGFAVYPMSLILIGLMIFGLDYRFGDLALPLAVFLIFSYDILIRIGETEILLLITLQPSFLLQIFFTAGAWIIALKPSVKITKYFLGFFVIYLLLAETRAYHLIEGSYYLTMIFSITYPKRSSK